MDNLRRLASIALVLLAVLIMVVWAARFNELVFGPLQEVNPLKSDYFAEGNPFITVVPFAGLSLFLAFVTYPREGDDDEE